jgi:aminomethyltransferase
VETSGADLKRTTLHEEHQALGARFTAFGGWEMPVQYSGIVAEHTATREKAGLFDLSHMGEFMIEGPAATVFLQRVTTNDVTRLAVGQAQYSMFLNPRGGVVDDIVVYRRAADRYLVVVNGANAAKDWAWVDAQRPEPGVDLRDASEEISLLAVQGPLAARLVSQVVDQPLDGLYYYHFVEGLADGVPAVIGRTGYTGEDGLFGGGSRHLAPPGRAGQAPRRSAGGPGSPGHAAAGDGVPALRQRPDRRDDAARGRVELGRQARQG